MENMIFDIEWGHKTPILFLTKLSTDVLMEKAAMETLITQLIFLKVGKSSLPKIELPKLLSQDS